MQVLDVIARNSDWFVALFAPVVIGRRNYSVWYWFFNRHLKASLITATLQRFRLFPYMRSFSRFQNFASPYVSSSNITVSCREPL